MDEIATLKKKVAARQKFLEKVIGFVEQLTTKHGKVRTEVGSSNTRVMAALTFENFSFKYDGGQTMFGGNTIEITYHPDMAHKDRALEVYWQSNKRECRVYLFDESDGWQTAIRRMMRNKKGVEARIKRAAETTAKPHQNRYEKRWKRETRVLEDARRLRVPASANPAR